MSDRGEQPTEAGLGAWPKVVLHEHLDGGLRPSTVLELADEVGHALPADDEAALAEWFHRGADRRSLELYLETFAHTVAVLQTPEALERVAYEAGEDLAADGVVHAEVRYAPELNTRRGLSMDDVLEATTAGFARAQRDHDVVLRTIVCAIRSERHSLDAAQAAVRWGDRGVVAFDLAGPEAGWPASDHLGAIETARSGGLALTLHAGEAAGLDSIRDALEVCGAQRLGHGVRIVDDLGAEPDGQVGELAARVRDTPVPLEVCPWSNVHTGAADRIEDHPVDRLLRAGFAVTINTDNRLMSDTSVTAELAACVASFGWGWDEVEQVTRNAIDAAFCGVDRKDELHRRVDRALQD